MAKLPLNPMTLAMFSYDKASNMLVGEMSQVEGFIGRLYDDACDVGIEIQGKYKPVRYGKAGVIYSRDGSEIEVFVFEPCFEYLRCSPNLPVLHMLNT